MFSGELASPKVYENVLKNFLGILLALVSIVKYIAYVILIFTVIFYIKNWTNLSDFFFIEEYKNERATVIIDILLGSYYKTSTYKCYRAGFWKQYI